MCHSAIKARLWSEAKDDGFMLDLGENGNFVHGFVLVCAQSYERDVSCWQQNPRLR